MCGFFNIIRFLVDVPERQRFQPFPPLPKQLLDFDENKEPEEDYSCKMKEKTQKTRMVRIHNMSLINNTQLKSLAARSLNHAIRISKIPLKCIKYYHLSGNVKILS